MSNNSYYVTIPIAGHAYVSVDNVASKQEAKEKAFEMANNHEVDRNVEIEWQTVHSFIEGNICHCPLPWKIEVENDKSE